MKRTRKDAKSITVLLSAGILGQTLLVLMLAAPGFAQGRSLGYTTQPYYPQPIVRTPVLGNPGFANPGFVNRSGFVPAYVPPPQLLPNGNYMMNGNPFYYSNSGYYYPWANNSAYGQIMYAPSASQSPTAQIPPLSTVFQDLLKYLDDKKAKGTISDADFKHLRRRATDLQTKYFSLRNAAEGSIDPSDEAQIRRDLDELGAEVSKSVTG